MASSRVRGEPDGFRGTRSRAGSDARETVPEWMRPFAPEQLQVIQRAIFEVLNAAPFTQEMRQVRRREIRALAARCVLNEARAGELDLAVLVYRSSILFCASQSILRNGESYRAPKPRTRETSAAWL